MYKLPVSAFTRLLTVFCVTALLSGISLSVRADEKSAAATPPYGAWHVTEAAAKSNVGLRIFFSPDGVFLMVDPTAGVGVAGTYTLGRSGMLVYVYGYGRSAEFINGAYSVDGDTMRIDVKSSGFMDPQQVVLQRMKLQ